MKKTISFLFSFLILAALFCAPVFAEKEIDFSEDLRLLYTEDQVYQRYNTLLMENEYTDYYNYKHQGNEITDETIISIDADQSTNKIEFWVCFTYGDGSTLSCNYLRTDMISKYQQLLLGNTDRHSIQFGYPNKNIVDTDIATLKEEAAEIIPAWETIYLDYFHVSTQSEDKMIRINKGLLLIDEKRNFYYMDFAENNINDPSIYPDELTLLVHPITDPALLEDLRHGYGDYNGEIAPFGEQFTETIGIILLILLFGILPLALVILGLILMIRSQKRSYQRINLILLLFSLAALLCFLILAALLIL